MKGPIKILLFASDPPDGSRLNIGEEVRRIERGLKETINRVTIELKVIWNTTPEDLLNEICRYRPQIVHYSGRGTGRGLILHGSGKSKLLEINKFISVLSQVKDSVKLLFMNSCFSSVSSRKIVNEIEHFICVEGYADDEAAVLFPGLFYRYMGYGYTAAKSLEIAKTELSIRNAGSGYKPQYFTKYSNQGLFINDENEMINEPGKLE